MTSVPRPNIRLEDLEAAYRREDRRMWMVIAVTVGLFVGWFCYALYIVVQYALFA